MEIQIFQHAKTKLIKRILQKKPKSITNLKFKTQAKISSFKNPHIKINLLPRGQNPLSYYAL
jgi:hypothetical protein